MYRINIHSPRHKEFSNEKIEEEAPAGLTQDEEKLNFLKALYFILGILSVFLTLFSYYTWTHTHSYSILVLTFTSFLSKISAVFGVIGCFRGIQDLKFRHEILTGEKEGIGKNFLMFSFSLMMLSLTLYLVFGSHALFYSERTQAYLEAYYHSNPISFDEYYGKSLEAIENWGVLLITISGYTAYLIIIVMICITYFAYLLSILYDSIDRMFEILNLNIMNLGLGMVYITVYCIQYHSQIKFDVEIPKNIPYAIIAVGAFLTAICALGFYVVYQGTLKVLKVYIIFNFSMIFISALCSTISIRSAHLFREGLTEKCFDFMAIVNSDYLSQLGCANKYLNMTNIEENQCAKGQNRYIWEMSETEVSYGCLNSYCCDVLVTDAKTKFDYLGLCAGAAVVLICISLWACYYIWKRIEGPARVNQFQIDLKITSWAVMSPILTIISILYFIPATPYLPPYLDADVSVTSATIIDPRLLSNNWCYSAAGLDISTSNLPCEGCLHSEFSIFFTSENGNNEKFTSAEFEKITEFLNLKKLCPVCRGLPSYWDIKISREDFYEDYSTENPM